MATALCVTAGREQVASIRKARAMGLRVVAIDGAKDAPGLREADAAYVLDPGDEEAVVELARREKAELVLPVPIGRLLRTIGAVNDALGLRGVTKAAAVACADKLLFRERLAASGMSQIEWRIANGREAVLRALERFSLPCVLKPRFGAGSRGVVVIRSRSEIEALVDEHLQFGDGLQDTLIEEYVAGPEVGVDAAVAGGRVTVTAVRLKTMTTVPYRQEVGYHGPAPLSSEQREQLRDAVEGAVRATGCDDALLNVDIILRESGLPHIVEMSPRPAGLLMAEQMVPAMTGVDYLREGIRMLLGEAADLSPRRAAPVALRFLLFPPGLVMSAPDCAWVSGAGGILAFSCGIRAGDRLRKITCAADVLSRGYVMATGSTLAEAIARTEDVMNRVCAATEVAESEFANR